MQRVRTRNISSAQPSLGRFKELEFKYLYFKLQKIINRKVQISLKYEQLKQPEINLTLIKPIVLQILELASSSNLNYKIRGNNGVTDFRAAMENRISLLVIHILLLLRYEYQIQSETNLIIYDLLVTKATVCELLVIRIFREYKAIDRVNLLFLQPMKKHTTLELAILTKSKRFLSQPVIVQILDKFYNGHLIIRKDKDTEPKTEESALLKENITNYKYQRILFAKINDRSILVPKYQSLLINVKNLIFTLLHVLIIVNQHKNYVPNNLFEILFYLIGAHLNYDFIMKAAIIEGKFLRKILWFYMDFAILVLIDINFILKGLTICNQVSEVFYFQTFSVLSILLIPRNLAVFNNYKFFNLILLGFKRMISNMIGTFCLFLSLVVGFYITFISLSQSRSNMEIAYDLVQIFFGFTPAVWTNWNSYTTIGKFTQLGYLFLSQFIISTILAIVLSESFSEISCNIKEDFEYFKAVNIVVYFKSSQLHSSRFGFITKFPILIILFVYEVIVSKLSDEDHNTKNFTFLNKEKDFYGDSDLVNMDFAHDESDVSLLIKSRKASAHTKKGLAPINPVVPSVNLGRRYSQVEAMNANSQFAANFAPSTPGNSALPNIQPSISNDVPTTPVLMPIKSISTLGNFKSASTDSLFIGDLLAKKYGASSMSVNKRGGKTKDVEWDIVLEKLNHLSEKMDKLEQNQHQTSLRDINQLILDDVDNDSVNLYKIRETSYDGLDLDVDYPRYMVAAYGEDDDDDDTLSQENSDDTF